LIMLVFVTAAHAAATNTVGWPCQRLNWAWRNVWSTCSINSFAPAPTTTVDVGNVGYRVQPGIPFATTALHNSGWYSPATFSGNPAAFCLAAPATGSGLTANLRNRCRRAIDAYGNLVKSCVSPPALGPNYPAKPPNTIPQFTPDVNPAANHAPHVTNVRELSLTASTCLLPTGSHSPTDLATPSTTCPRLLGWFTVVYNACGFTNAPGLTGATPGTVPLVPGNFPAFVPIAPNSGTNGVGAATNTGLVGAGTIGTAVFGSGLLTTPGRAGFFCGPLTNGGTSTVIPNTPSAWNDAPVNSATPPIGQASTVFRTSRCRKALDQFGRTATRCHLSTSSSPAGPAQAGGYSDPLRFLAVGHTSSPQGQPNGMNYWAPLCN